MYKTVYDLTTDQINELKMSYLTQHLLEAEDRTPSWGELANAANIVSDAIIFGAYEGVCFTDEDFCS